MKTKIKLPRCQNCGNEFLPSHKKQKFCSDACRQRAWQEQQKEKQKN